MRFNEVFRALQGRWQLSRRMSDGSTFCGVAEFVAESSDRYRMEEKGELVLAGGGRLGAGRTWHWSLAGPETIEIRYAGERDGDLYHLVEFNADGKNPDGPWQGSARHFCGADTYDGYYVIGAGRIEIRHSIAGPAKNMSIDSLFSRNAGQPDRKKHGQAAESGN